MMLDFFCAQLSVEVTMAVSGGQVNMRCLFSGGHVKHSRDSNCMYKALDWALVQTLSSPRMSTDPTLSFSAPPSFLGRLSSLNCLAIELVPTANLGNTRKNLLLNKFSSADSHHKKKLLRELLYRTAGEQVD